MRDFTAYLLHFTSPLHLGDSRSDYGTCLQTFSSDGMYAALTAMLAMLDGHVPQGGDLGCTISALFPFCQLHEGDQPLLFYPRPLSAELPQIGDMRQAKRVKKVKWIDQCGLEQTLAGELVIDEKAMSNVCGRYMTCSKTGFDENFMKAAVVQRVSIPSVDYCTNPVPFYMDRLHFQGRSGLFFLCEGNTTWVDRAMPLLQQCGIGTDRNVGNGFFEYEKKEVKLAVPETADAAVSLSTYIPSSQEELKQMMSNPSYACELIRRGGWMSETLVRKNAIYAYAPGSVFAWVGNTVGAIHDLAPHGVEHPVYRCGRSIMLPFNANNHE